MKSGGKALGILLILGGACFLMNEAGLFDGILGQMDFSPWGIVSALIGAAFGLWPLLLVAAGLAIIFKNRIFGRVLWILIILALGAYMVLGPVMIMTGLSGISRFDFGDMFHITVNDSGSDEESTAFTNTKEMDFSTDIKAGTADISLGACNMLLLGTDDKAAIVKSNIDGLKSEWNIDGGIMALSIHEEDIVSGMGTLSRNAHFYFSERIPWNLTISTGASKTEMDLRELMIQDLDFEAGAGSAVIQLGSRLPVVSAKISGGASEISLVIPEGSGIRIEKEEGLSGSNFEAAGLLQISEGVYESENYATAENKINVGLSTGISNIRLSRE